jgi:hypothetical protein
VRTLLRIIGAFIVLVVAILFGAGGGCYVGFAVGSALPSLSGGEGLGAVGLGLLGAVVGLIAGAAWAARVLRRMGD